MLQLVAHAQRRGAEIFASDLGDALARRGFEVRTAALSPGSPGEESPVPVLGSWRRARKAAGGAAVVVGHGSKALPAGALATAGRSSAFVYRSIGEPWHWAAGGMAARRTAFLLRRAATVVVLWPGAADALARHFGVPPSRIEVITNGVPASRFATAGPDERAAARARLGLEGASPLLVFLGSLTPEKEVGTAIRALRDVPGGHLLVVGQGPERGALEQAAAAEAPGRVTFAGATDDPAAALAAADVVVLPSRTEGVPAVLVEAAFRGVPAVASRVGGVAEVVADGETGALVDPGDPGALAAAVRAVTGDPGMGERAGRRCRERFELELVADQWAGLLERLGARRAAGRP